MLEELRIEALGVIDDATMRFGPGLTVVTGETGAGKTMVVSGLALLFGARADTDRVRAGAERSAVEGHVGATDAAARRVAEAGGELDERTVVLRRVVTATGRSRGYAGGAAVPVGVLADLGEELLTIHGQAGQLRLTRPAEQRAALDRYAGIDLTGYRAAFQRWQDAERRLAERVRDADSLTTEAEVLALGLAEIERAAPQPGEDVQLAALASRLAHVDALRRAARDAHDALVGSADDPAYDGPDVLALLAPALRECAQLGGADAGLDALAERLHGLSAQAADLAGDLAEYESGLDADPAELQRAEERRAELTALTRRYGRGGDPLSAGTVQAVLDWARRAAARHAEIDVSEDALGALRDERDAARTACAALAEDVGAQRAAAAEKLAAAVTGELAGLAMAGAGFVVSVTARPPVAGQPALPVDGAQAHAGPEGTEDVGFALRADAATTPVPLQRGASGGELSRIMLALEVVLADTDPVPTMIFDEVDAGVGGRAAVEVGRRLARLARSRQVIVVTHLAQVAAFATNHLVVDKSRDDSRPGTAVTSSAVRTVADADREAELARMLAGSDTAAARRHAAELLAQAHQERTVDAAPQMG